MKWKNSLNYIGQLRFYSLADLILLLIAIHANYSQFFGVILLHLGFLMYLECSHNHSYRKKFPTWLAIILFFGRVLLYWQLTVIGFIVGTILYVKKNKSFFGFLSPVFRGAQLYFISSGIVGLLSPLSFLAGGLTAIRNLLGDFRDVSKDKKDGTKTIPIVIGIKKDFKYLHLVFLLLTSFVWWYISNISLIWLFVVYVIELATYTITPR